MTLDQRERDEVKALIVGVVEGADEAVCRRIDRLEKNQANLKEAVLRICDVLDRIGEVLQV